MKHYEVTFVVDPVLSGDEIKATEKAYEEMLKNEGCTLYTWMKWDLSSWRIRSTKDLRVFLLHGSLLKPETLLARWNWP